MLSALAVPSSFTHCEHSEAVSRHRCGSDASADSGVGDTEAGVVVKGLRRGSWEMVQDSSLGVYFYNYRTDESQWEAPECFAADVR